MSSQQKTVAACDLKVLKDFVAEQKDVLLILGKEGCAVCDQLERDVLPKFNTENKDVAVAQVTLKEGDMECQAIVADLALKTVPVLIAYKGGVEVERQNVGGDRQRDLQVVRQMAMKVRSAPPVNASLASQSSAATQ